MAKVKQVAAKPMEGLSVSQRKKLRELRMKVRDFYECHPHEINKNGILRIGARVFEDLKWALDLIDGKKTKDNKTIMEADALGEGPEEEETEIDEVEEVEV